MQAKQIFREACRISKAIDSPTIRSKFIYNAREIIEYYSYSSTNPSTRQEMKTMGLKALETLKKIVFCGKSDILSALFKPFENVSLDELERKILFAEREETKDTATIKALQSSLTSAGPYLPRRVLETLQSRVGKLISQSQTKPSLSFPDFHSTEQVGVSTAKPQNMAIKKRQPTANFYTHTTNPVPPSPQNHYISLHDQSIQNHLSQKSIKIKDCKRVDFSLGVCSGALYIEGCSDCSVKAAAHQIRLLDCQNINLSVFVATSIIIENCQGITSDTPIESQHYPEFSKDLHAAHMNLQQNKHMNMINFTQF